MGIGSRVWQKTMIGLATNGRLKAFMQRRATTALLASCFVTGRTPEAGVRLALNVPAGAATSSLYYLGEYVGDRRVIEENVVNKIAAARLLGKSELDVHVSVDPTQIGYSIDRELCRRNAFRIAAAIGAVDQRAAGVHCMMLDMEDDALVEDTIALHDALKQEGHPVAITLQAYLRRTCHDLEKLIHQGGVVRIVKGAFSAGADLAYTSQREIRRNFLRLADIALSPEARSAGFYPSFATHDERLHRAIIKMAADGGWRPGSYEFEMLHGVKTDVAERLVSQGQKLRLYIPFGTDWWPYALRRIGENPRYVLLLLRAFIARR